MSGHGDGHVWLDNSLGSRGSKDSANKSTNSNDSLNDAASNGSRKSYEEKKSIGDVSNGSHKSYEERSGSRSSGHEIGKYMNYLCLTHRVGIERKCPYKKKLKGAWVSPLYFDNNDVTYK